MREAAFTVRPCSTAVARARRIDFLVCPNDRCLPILPEYVEIGGSAQHLPRWTDGRPARFALLERLMARRRAVRAPRGGGGAGA